tara:strand:+ start:757 stop:972 length:216 start_codon:yes stop_codon:yes gene_type:complete
MGVPTIEIPVWKWNALKDERDELRESVKDLLDLTEYGDIDTMVWELVNDGDEWVVERLNRAQRLIDKGGER